MTQPADLSRWVLRCPVNDGCAFEATGATEQIVRTALRAHLERSTTAMSHPDCHAAHTVLSHDDHRVVDALMALLRPTHLIVDHNTR